MNKRLTNAKTGKEAGLEYLFSKVQIKTPFGQKALKEQKPFFPGDEEGLSKELDRVETLTAFVRDDREVLNAMEVNVFHDMKDISNTLTRSQEVTLSVVELFEVKSLLLKMEALLKLWDTSLVKLPEEFRPEDTSSLLDLLDPRGDRLGNFYIYEEFSKELGELREEKRHSEMSLRKIQRGAREKLKKEFGIVLTPKCDCAVSKAESREVDKYSNCPYLGIVDQDYMSITFALMPDNESDQVLKQMDAIQVKMEEEEERVQKMLSEKIWEQSQIVGENCRRIGLLDLTIAKAAFGAERNCTRPEICKNLSLEIHEGRHLYVEDVLVARGKEYVPVSLSLVQGVTCITGANMGGKTVTLKLVGLLVAMAQYGYFVSAKHMEIGLFDYMQMLIGDSQSVERGLSSFGSEMEELKEILDKSRDRSLLLIDEIASGTNPQEGMALTHSIIEYLKDKAYISLITTHFDVRCQEEKVNNLQVIGLANVDFNKLNKEIRYANRKARIQIIGKYMDYRLQRIDGCGVIPKDALNIAKMLGIGGEIIDTAKKYLKEQNN